MATLCTGYLGPCHHLSAPQGIRAPALMYRHIAREEAPGLVLKEPLGQAEGQEVLRRRGQWAPRQWDNHAATVATDCNSTRGVET